MSSAAEHGWHTDSLQEHLEVDAVGTSTVSLGAVGYRALKGYGAAKNAADDETRGPDQGVPALVGAKEAMARRAAKARRDASKLLNKNCGPGTGNKRKEMERRVL